MGVVWLGRHELLSRDVAVKFLLHLTPTEDDPAFEALLRGARAAAAFHHPGLNQVFHADVIDGVPFLVLELIQGRDLSEIVAERGPLDLGIARAVLAEVCEATAQLHDRDLIHRDIKPANIMVSEEGRCVLTDFGLAIARRGSSFGASVGARAGTVAYMAPEMFDGVASSRTDVYALGATAFHLLCGHPPFRGDTVEVVCQKRETPLEIGALHARGVPPAVIEVVERAMNPVVLFRPRSARHVLDALESAWDRAGVRRADQSALAGLLRKPPGQTEAAIAPELVSTYYEQLSTFAAKHHSEIAHTRQAESAGTNQFAPDPTIREKLALEKKQVRWATVIAIGVGGILTMLVGLATQGAVVRASVWFSTDKRTRSAAPVWSDPLMYGAILVGGGLAMLVALRVFQSLTPRRARGMVSVHCGQCGYERKGVTDPRCSECGHVVGADLLRAEAGSNTKLRMWAESAIVPGAFGVAALLFDSLAFPIRRFGTDDQPLGLIVLVSVMVALGVMIAVKLFDRSEQDWFKRCGLSWCAACGTELRNQSGTNCPKCSRPI